MSPEAVLLVLLAGIESRWMCSVFINLIKILCSVAFKISGPFAWRKWKNVDFDTSKGRKMCCPDSGQHYPGEKFTVVWTTKSIKRCSECASLILFDHSAVLFFYMGQISTFFPSLPHRNLCKILQKLNFSNKFLEFLEQFCDMLSRFSRFRGKRRVGLLKKANHRARKLFGNINCRIGHGYDVFWRVTTLTRMEW